MLRKTIIFVSLSWVLLSNSLLAVVHKGVLPGGLNAYILTRNETMVSAFGYAHSGVSKNLELGVNAYALTFLPNLFAKYQVLNEGKHKVAVSAWAGISNPVLDVNWDGSSLFYASVIDSIELNSFLEIHLGLLGGRGNPFLASLGATSFKGLLGGENFSAIMGLAGVDYKIGKSASINFSFLPYQNNNISVLPGNYGLAGSSSVHVEFSNNWGIELGGIFARSAKVIETTPYFNAFYTFS